MARNTVTRRSERQPSNPEAAVVAATPVDPGFITVRVGKLPGRIDTIALNGGRTVKDSLEGANIDATGYEIKVNASAANLETVVKEGDTVLVVKKANGNI